MSTTRGGDPAPDGQEGPAGTAGVQTGTARASEGVDRNSGPRRGDAVPEAGEGGIAGASGGPREVALERGSPEEDSDIGPAEDGEEEQAGGLDLIVDARHSPMAGFRLTFLDLVRSLLNGIYCNDLVQRHEGHVSVRHRAQQHSSDQGSAEVAEFSDLWVSSDGPGEGPAGKAPAQEVEEAEEAEEASLWETATEESEESSLWEMAQEPAAPEEITKYQDENSEKEAQDTESEGKEEKYNKKQEEPENNLDPAKDRPRKSSLED
ncbi:cancer/testis antigen family 47 member C1 [Dama dama]|uniref:cancer/testis antigen family 47 member C1 n=1 Tax=Dama dama TaxID=30532 RepID=UPI002A366E78|nr:cancer/testis antigen family 47 member C1 [Dama dama]